MKYLLILFTLLSFLSCKEKCYNCQTYKLTNIKEVQKRCDGLAYDLDNFEEIHIGADTGTVCGKDELESKESEIQERTFSLCAEIRYTERLFVKCE